MSRDEGRLVIVLEALVNQVARVAWAIEAPQHDPSIYECLPCTKCGSQLVEKNNERCSACLEPKKEYINARDRDSLE